MQAVFPFLVLLVFGCTDTGNLFGSTNPVPGANNAYAFGNQASQISLVSLIFPNRGEIESVDAVDRITGEPIRFDLFETSERLVVTLKLPMGRMVNPHLVFGEDISFTALLLPRHSLSTFDGLMFGDYTVFLRDHGVESELELNGVMEIPCEEFADLWVVDRLVPAARVRFQNPGEAGDFTFLAPASCEALVLKKDRLESSKNEPMKLGDHESVSFVVTPLTDTDVIDVSVTN